MGKLPIRKRGPKPKTGKRSVTQKLMDGLESESSEPRKHISGKARKFIALAAQDPVTDPNTHALTAGYSEPYIGEKLYLKYTQLIALERARSRVGEQMELDEALSLCAERARALGTDEKVALGYTTLILRVHGALSDKPLTPKARRQLSKDAAEIVQRIQAKLEAGGKRGRVTVGMQRTATRETIGVAIDEASASSSPIDVEAQALPADPSIARSSLQGDR